VPNSESILAEEIIGRLADESQRRLALLRQELDQRLSEALPPEIRSKIAIYATGSLARLEATEYSDLDAFFYVFGSEQTNGIEQVHAISTFYEVVKASEVARFPEFSGGGEYLKFQYLDDVLSKLGSREDDYINALTSRMLLILESAYLFNDPKFRLARQTVIDRYFADFPQHSQAFRPIFLVNDVLRFWRTLCINYEHSLPQQRHCEKALSAPREKHFPTCADLVS
jgi:hypothetical protein